MSNFKAGFARLDVTPPFGVNISGYYEQRVADGILDNLYASAIAVSDGFNTAVIISADVIGIPQVKMNDYRKSVAERNSISFEAVFIACTHTHTGPVLANGLFADDPNYNNYLERRLSDVTALAIQDLKPASASIGRSVASGISFVRRFRMKNGKIQTNPGVGNQNVLEPIGTPDETVQLVRLHRDNAEEILLVNFQVHPDVIGGTKFSADYPKFVRDTLEKSLDNVHCIYFNGAQGDTNHINVFTTPDKANRGYEHSKHMGRCIAGAVLQIFTKTSPVSSEQIKFGQQSIEVPSNRVDKSMIPAAENIIALHKAGRDEEIPFKGMELTTVVAEAHRIKRLENGPDAFELPLTAISFGDVSIAGVPGEPFTDIGRSIKSGSPFEMTFVCCCANGYEGYYPMKPAFDEGGYEARSSKYKPGVAEAIIAGSVDLLKKLKKA
jgi:neutral ceramidase